MRKRKIERLASTLDKILASRGLGSRLREYRILGRWDKIVGPAISRHAQPLSLRNKKLTIIVDSSAWMQQLSLLKPELLEKVSAALGKEAVQSISLKLGEVFSSTKAIEEQPRTGTLEAGEQERIESIVKDIKDADIRESLRHVMQKDFLRKKLGLK